MIKKNKVCLPYLNFLICYPKHAYFFIWPSAETPLQTVWTQIRPDKMSDLIWIQNVGHCNGILERIFSKKLILKKIKTKNNTNLPRTVIIINYNNNMSLFSEGNT